jgi:DNA-binding transcriptional LysR family regulator
MVVCASPQYLAKHGTPQHPQELTQHEVISYNYLSTKDEWRFEGPEGPVSVKTNPWIHTNSGDTCRAIALENQGVIMQPTFLVGDDIAQGRLVQLMAEFSAIELGIYAVYPSRKHVTPKVRVLIDYLAEHFQKQAADW